MMAYSKCLVFTCVLSQNEINQDLTQLLIHVVSQVFFSLSNAASLGGRSQLDLITLDWLLTCTDLELNQN